MAHKGFMAGDDDTWQAWTCPKCSSDDILWVEEANDEIRELVKKTKETRDQMGGALYFNVLNEEYHNLLNYCLKNGINLNKEEN